MTPVRIQRQRTPGYRMPPNTVSVTRPNRYGNLWKVGLVSCGCRSAGECAHNSFRCETAADAVAAFRAWRADCDRLHPARAKEYYAAIRGKNLACFCALDQPCHADVLLEIANRVAA